jgi:hypothetical protein
MRWLAIGVLASAVGCGGGGKEESPPATEVTQNVGPGGGTVSLTGGPSLAVPPGALDSVTAITIRKAAAGAPTGALGPLYEFGPDGEIFSVPVTISFPVAQGTAAAMVYWTKAGSATEFDALPTTLAGTTASASVTHFSHGYVGEPFRGLAECTARGAFRMYALLSSLHGILRHVTFGVALPDGVLEPTASAYEFSIRDDHASATIQYTTDPYPVGAVAIFRWTLTQESRVGSTGEGQFSAVRLGADTLQMTPSDVSWFEPDLTCRVDLEAVGFYVGFLSDQADMTPEASMFQTVARVGSETLDGSGGVGHAGVAAMTGTYRGVPYSYQIDLETGAVSF